MDAVTSTAAALRKLGAPRGRAGKAPRTIRTRLLRILVLALAVLLALFGAVAAEQIGAYRNASETAANARLEVTIQGLVHELQKERALTVGHVGGVDQLRGKLPAQRKATDTALAGLDRALRGRGDGAAGSVRHALARFDGLAGIRRQADTGHGRPQGTFDWFTRSINGLDLLGLGLGDVRDQRLHATYQTLMVLGYAKEFAGQERAVVLGSLTGGQFTGDGYSRFLQIRAGRLAALGAYPDSATAVQKRRLNQALGTPDARRALWYENVAVGGEGRLDAARIPADAWWRTMTSANDGLRDVQISLGHDVESRAAALERHAQRDLLLFVLIAFATVLALGVLAYDCVRSVSGPLAELAQQAREVAGRRLPQAVAAMQSGALGDRSPEPPPPLDLPAGAGAEALEVAEAFDRVQRSAFDLATEQAVLRRNATESLVSLGRRNQNLVRRQLSFINKLEQDADSATLANLFELDHLATRMRRNAESLLVLAGESSPRSWSTPQAVTDVLRAALSEVENYRRVTLRRVEAVGITGSVVAEIAHLLAELIENALSFSPPDSDVELEGRRTSAGYLIAIVDHGLGMDTQALAEANVRLSGRASFMADPSRFLGHFVVGALARKCGIEVRVGEAPTAGVVARVLVPTTLLTEPPAGRPVTDKAVLPAPRPAVARTGRATEDRQTGPAPTSPVPPAASAAQRPARTAASRSRPARPAEPQKGEPARGADAARTRNGLVKRPRRSAITAAVSESDRTSRPGPAVPARERSPEEVSGMLSTLRSAHMRGAISVEKERERERLKEEEQRATAGAERRGAGDRQNSGNDKGEAK